MTMNSTSQRDCFLFVLTLTVLVCGCGRDRPETVTLDLSEFSLTCAQNSDCVVVNELACATFCEAEAAPLRVDDQSKYDRLRERHSDECRSAFVIDCVGEDDATWPSHNLALCVNEQCTVRPRMSFHPDETQTCRVDSDCALVQAGDPCECSCDMIAVNPSVGGDIIRARGSVDCGMSTEECSEPCSSEFRAMCVDGECMHEAVSVGE